MIMGRPSTTRVRHGMKSPSKISSSKTAVGSDQTPSAPRVVRMEPAGSKSTLLVPSRAK